MTTIKSCFSIIAIFIACVVWGLPPQAAYASRLENGAESSGSSLSVEYLEDKNGSLKLEQVQTKAVSQDFRLNGSSFLTFGNSRSTWWIRLEGGYPNTKYEELYLSVNHASIENVVLYLPCISNGIKSWSIMKSGWQYMDETDDVDFLYPVFKLPDNLDRNQYIYIRIQSDYSHNYGVRLLKENEFNALRQKNLLFVALLLGTLLTMAVINFVIFFLLNDKTYLYYVIYIISMFTFQAVMLGVPRVLHGAVSGILIRNTSAISCVMMVTAAMFVRSFLETSKNVPKHDFVLKLLMAGSILIMLPMFFGWRFEANVASNYLANLLEIAILSAAVICIRKKVRQAKFFLLAWTMLLIGAGVFIMRSWGVLANSFLTQHFLLISAAMEAILFSIALIDRARSLQEEKQKAENMLIQANEEKRFAEIAFLQAQIKPHFLYNSLSVITALTVKDPPRAKELLYNLSDYLRGSFDFKNINGTTMLTDELATVKAYLAIEKERFRDKLAVEYDIDEAVKISVPMLTIQPLVENALRHGIFKKPEGGCIRISVKTMNCFVVITVQDDGVGIPQAKLAEILANGGDSKGVGLGNINKRLDLNYGQGLEIESREGYGTTVTIRIPAISGGKSDD